MNHVELHNNLSNLLNDLADGTVRPEYAREYFNGTGKLIANCKNELIAVSMGAALEIPLLDISSAESKKLVRPSSVKKIK